ncbi:MAG: hypothetical protein P4L46_07370 [Fimbriimonas sp.]|nr:hypothetical protein [Fimbriimonas sp.]
MNRKSPAQGKTALISRVLSISLAIGIFSSQALGGQRLPTDDPTASLRRFPISLMVKRNDKGGQPIPILRVDTLRPRDDVLVSVDDRLKGNWTLVAATVGAGERIRVRTWNLWDKRITRHAIDTGPLPDADLVPLYFLVLNKPKEHRVFDGIRHALETTSQLLISQTAIFETKYTQQNRLLNFMTAYASLGPKTCPDPLSMQNRVDAINLDLGATYDPTLQYTSPGQLQHGLDASVGVLDAMRQSPDNPTPAAAVVRTQLPGIVSDWVSLVGDLMHVFIKPPHDVKFTFVPASATEADASEGFDENWIDLVTQRVLETTDDSLPTIVYRPPFSRNDAGRPIRLDVARTEVLAGPKEIAIPLGADCRSLFVYPWAWHWEYSVAGQPFVTIPGARLVPGRGLVFPIADDWWGKDSVKTVYLRARIGFEDQETKAIEIAKVAPQSWSIAEESTIDFASGDPSIVVKLKRKGPTQPFYRYASIYLKDSSGKITSAEGVNDHGSLEARFNLSSVSPGNAQIYVLQEEAGRADSPVGMFVAPKHPSVSVICGKGDRMLRITGPEASWVKSIQIPDLSVQATDNSEATDRRLTLSGPVPANVRVVNVTYHDPQHGLEWTRKEPISMGEARPRIRPIVVGPLAEVVSIGSGPDPDWAQATMPTGWFRTKQPLRIQLAAIQPFVWSHDVSLELGFGSAGDIQSALTLPEGPSLAIDGSSPDAYLTLNLEALLPPTAKRNTGLLWVKLTRSDLSSPWTLVDTSSSSGTAPIRAVKLPTIESIQATATGTRITLGLADQVLGAKFAGQATFQPLQLIDSPANDLRGTIDGPPNVTEFDLEFRDADEGVVHIKVIKKP